MPGITYLAPRGEDINGIGLEHRILPPLLTPGTTQLPVPAALFNGWPAGGLELTI